MGRNLGIATLLGVALFSSCASGGKSATLAEADRALLSGQHERAWQLYEVALADLPDDALVTEKATLARRRAAQDRLDSAKAAEKQGDLDGALEHLSWAARYAPRDADLREESARVEATRRRARGAIRQAEERLDAGEGAKALLILEPVSKYRRTFPEIDDLVTRSREAAGKDDARRLKERGDDLLETGEPLEAHRAYREALELAPGTEGAEAGLEAARKASAARILEEAHAASSRGEPGAALAAIESGKEALGDVDPDLLKLEAALRLGIRERLREAADAHREAGRPALALVLLRAAARVDPLFASEEVDGAEAALGAELTLTVRVDEFEDGTGGRVDPGDFTARVRAALEEAPPGRWIRVAVAGDEPSVTAAGSVTSIEVEEAEPRAERRVHEHLLRVEREENPARPRIEAHLRTLRSHRADAVDVWEAASDELDSLEEMKGRARVHQQSGRRVGPYTQAAYYRILGNARDREARARQERDRLDALIESVRDRLEATPPYIEKEIHGRTYFDAVTRTKNAHATAEVRIEGPSASSFSESATVTVTDTAHAAIPQVGLAADPDEMQTDVEVADRLLDDLAAGVAGGIGSRARALRRALLDKARELERAGDAEAALDRYAAFALVVGEGMELERANACGRVRKRYGIDLSGETVSVEELRY